MPFDLEEFQDLKEKVERAEKKAQKAEWELGKCLEELKEQYNCETVEQAEKLLVELEQEEKEAMEAYEKEFEAFMEKWKEGLDE